MHCSKEILNIATDIIKAGGSAYYVGGCVRDRLLNIRSNDIDIEVYGITFEKLLSILESYEEYTIDKRAQYFGILSVQELNADFSLPRLESSSGLLHTDFSVKVDETLDFYSATKRRDFTINAILSNVSGGEIIDMFGGLADISQQLISCVNSDTFADDPLRFLRAARFASKLQFIISDQIMELSKTVDYTTITSYMIKREIDKILLTDKPSIAMNYLMDMGVIRQLFPELYALKGCEQSPLAHAEGDAWNHTMLVIDAAAKVRHYTNHPLHFMYASLFHDIGKPLTFKNVNGKISNHKHDVVGAQLIPKAINILSDSSNVIEYVSYLTLNHMRMHCYTELKTRKAQQLILDGYVEDLFYLLVADERGRVSTLDRNRSLEDVRERIMQHSNDGFGKFKCYINGHELLNMGAKADSSMSHYLDLAIEYQLQGISKDESLRRLAKLITKNLLDILGITDTNHRNHIIRVMAKQQLSNKLNNDKLSKLITALHFSLISGELQYD